MKKGNEENNINSKYRKINNENSNNTINNKYRKPEHINNNINNKNYKINYQKELDRIIDDIKKTEQVPTLLLHSCCGPCSSYVLEYLSEYFSITVFYYNPNIYPSEEYWYRVEEQKKIIDATNAKNPIAMITGKYDVEKFYEIAKGLEYIPEGGERCHRCYELRLREAALIAKEKSFDYFTTTLSISPHKNSQVLNRIGENIAKEYGIYHLPSDFKKNNGYKRSVEITNSLGLYRQDYCGCEFSKLESEKRKIQKEKKHIREYIKDLSSKLDKDYMVESEDKIIKKLVDSKIYKDSKNIFCYVGKYPEINTSKFIQKAIKDGKTVSVPYCINKEEMLSLKINSIDELKQGKFGILEPDKNSEEMKKVDVDLVIVPCCTADKYGNRLGFGRGYYDRYLEDTSASKVLLIRKKQMVEQVPMEEHDKKIDYIIYE